MIVFHETSFLFLFSKPKFWAYSKWTVSLWHSWDLRACMEGKYIPSLDLSQEDPRGIYCTSEFPSTFHDCNSCVLFCIHNWLICIFKGLIRFLFLIWRHMISFSLYSQGLWLLFSISLPCHLWEQIREKITLLDYWDKERIIQAAKEKRELNANSKIPWNTSREIKITLCCASVSLELWGKTAHIIAGALLPQFPLRPQHPGSPKIPSDWSHLIDKFLSFPGPTSLAF